MGIGAASGRGGPLGGVPILVTPLPTLGRHTVEVLREDLGLGDDERADLAAHRVIAGTDAPVG